MPALSGTAAGAERAQIRPPRVKEGGSDTAKRCFRGPHELAFIRSKIFIYPQFASSGGVRVAGVMVVYGPPITHLPPPAVGASPNAAIHDFKGSCRRSVPQ